MVSSAGVLGVLRSGWSWKAERIGILRASIQAPNMLFRCSGCLSFGRFANALDRFHAWQSALLFTAIMIFHLLFSWSRFLSWMFFIGDLVLMVWLALKAYQDADTLDRYSPSCLYVLHSWLTGHRFEVPFFGRIASRILDDE